MYPYNKNMGATTSKVDPNDVNQENEMDVMHDIETKGAIVDKVIVDNIENLGKLVSQFNKNDTEAILDQIKNSTEFKGKFPEQLLSRIGGLHQSILNTIDSSLTPDDKKKEMETDANIQNYISKFVDKDTDEKMKEYLDSPFIKNDQVVLRSMTDVTGSIKNIRSKYKYFEYKYVQMNLFLIMFTKFVYTTVNKFISESAALYEAREKYHLVMIHNVIKTFQNIFKSESDKLTNIDTSSFTEAIKLLTKDVTDGIMKQRAVTEGMKKQSLNDILKFLMQETEFAQEIVGVVGEYTRNNPSGTQPTEYGPPTDPNKPQFIPYTTVNRDAKGVRLVPERSGYAFKREGDREGYFLNTDARPTQKFLEDAEYQSLRRGLKGYYNRRSTGEFGPGYYLINNKRPDVVTLQFIPLESIPKNESGDRPAPSGYVMKNGTQGLGFYLIPGRQGLVVQRGGFIRDLSLVPNEQMADAGPIDMRGGFIRDGSFLPQKFFQL
jgi:hypothetical protein